MRNTFSIATLLIATSMPISVYAGEKDGPFSFGGVYIADYMNNYDGGIKEGTAYLDGLFIEGGYENNIGALKLRGKIGGFYVNGAEFSSNHVGDLQGISNVETGYGGLFLANLWLELGMGAELDGESAGLIRVGILDLNSVFDAPGVSGIFLNPSHGIIPTFSQTGLVGPSIFPSSGLAVTGQLRLSENLRLRSGAFDALPAKIDKLNHIDLTLNKEQGALFVGEAEWKSPLLRLVVGGFGYSAKVDSLDAISTGKNGGFYSTAELNPEGKISGFVRYGTAKEKLNSIENYLGAGLVANDVLGFKEHVFGVSLANAQLSNAAKALLANPKDTETTYEITYSLPIGPRVTVQGDYQFVKNPAGDGDIKDANIVGLRVSYSFGDN